MPNNRLPHAAKVLIAQVQEKHKTTTATGEGDPDGLNVYRKVKFEKAGAKWLGSIIDHLDDARIVGSEKSGTALVVEFTHTQAADDRTTFPLEAAETVAKSESK